MTPSVLLRLAPLAVILAALASCISNANVINSKATAQEAAGKAIVIVSVSHDISVPDASDQIVIDRGAEAVMVASAAPRMAPAIQNDFKDKIGHVYVLEVTPGHHSFTDWNATWQGSSTKKIGEQLPLGFDVARGEVLYLGNLHVHWVVEKAWVTNRMLAQNASVVVSDQSDTDVAIAEHAHPAIAGRVRTALLPLGPWRHTTTPSK